MEAEPVEQAARRHVPGTGPVAIEPLGRGLVNESYRVVREGRVYSLRVPAAQPAPIDIDREWECRVLAAASAAGLAAPIERCEPRLGVLVAPWQEGDVLGAQQARAPCAAAQVAQLTRRVHALPPPPGARRLGPADWIETYRGALARLPPVPAGRDDRSALEVLEAQAGAQLRALEALPPVPRVLCHSDLHPGNVVSTARGLVLLDWEYAHVSEALWDVAGWACNNDLAPAARAVLLASYLGRPPAAQEERRLEHLGWLYDYVCWLWSEVYCGVTGALDVHILDRRRMLAARLAQGGGGAGELAAH